MATTTQPKRRAATAAAPARPREPAATKVKTVRATEFGADHIPPTTAGDETPMFAGGGFYANQQKRKPSRTPLIAGGIASLAALGLIAAVMFTGQPDDTQPADTVNVAALSGPLPQPAPIFAADTQLIPPAPAPVVRQQARIAPRRTAPSAVVAPDAATASADVSATAPEVPEMSPATEAASRALAAPTR